MTFSGPISPMQEAVEHSLLNIYRVTSPKDQIPPKMETENFGHIKFVKIGTDKTDGMEVQVAKYIEMLDNNFGPGSEDSIWFAFLTQQVLIKRLLARIEKLEQQ